MKFLNQLVDFQFVCSPVWLCLWNVLLHQSLLTFYYVLCVIIIAAFVRTELRLLLYFHAPYFVFQSSVVFSIDVSPIVSTVECCT